MQSAVHGAMERGTLIEGRVSVEQVTRDVADAAAGRPTRLWVVGMLIALSALAVGVAAIAYTCATGLGTWGLNSNIGWAFDITNFVFWVGIGHAGTLISAILLLFRQRWRNAINRSAEAMTLFAVMCAGIFPVIHLGRPWLALWVIPYPNGRGPLWVNFKSPLLWDFFAIATYFSVSLLFWYVGLIPDLATLRDRTPDGRTRAIYAFFALGWNGSHRLWHRYETLYLLMAGLATPLVLSVHTVVSWDFGVSILPGWHSTIFPPYFVDGAILSGLSMVLTLLIVVRKVMRFEQYITLRHIEAICTLVIVTGGIIGVSYGIETFVGLYSGNPYERFAVINRVAGPLAWTFWLMVVCNVAVPQLFWFRAIRRNLVVVFILSLCVNVGMWFERFTIIVASLQRSFLESTWTNYTPTFIELAILVGSFGLFFTAFLLFARALPMISIAEVKSLLAPHPHDIGYEEIPESNAGFLAAGPEAGQHVQFIAEFDSESQVLAAARASFEHGIEVASVYSPCPVEGLGEALNLRKSRLPWACLAGGVMGVLVMTAFVFWTSTVSWPVNIGGKPWNSLPAYLPPIFETMILWAVFTTFLAFLFRCRLWPWMPLRPAVAGATDDRFIVVIDPAPALNLAELGAVRAWFAPFNPRRVTQYSGQAL